MLNDSEYLNQGQQFNKKQNQQTMIEGFATNIFQQKQTRDAQNTLTNTAETNTLNDLNGKYVGLDGQYTQASANLSSKTNKVITRISSANTNLNKNITLGTVSLPITDNGNGGYVTGKGVFKSYPSQDIKDNTIGKNGCSSSFTQVQKNNFSDSLIQGTPMQSGQACGNEGKNVYVSSLNSNPITTYVGCYRDKNTINANTAMTYDSNAIGITDFNTCKQYASENGYSYFGMQNLQSSGLAQCVVSNNSIDTIKNNGDASAMVKFKPLWSSNTVSSVSNSMKLNGMGQLEVFNTITENIVFSTTNTVPECVNSGKIKVTSASYDINCNQLVSGFTNLFSSTIEGLSMKKIGKAVKKVASKAEEAAEEAAEAAEKAAKEAAQRAKEAAERAAKEAAQRAKEAAEKAAKEAAQRAKEAAAAKTALDSAARSISMASVINSTRTSASERSAAERAAAERSAAERSAAAAAAARAAVAAKAAADRAAAERAAAEKRRADREAEDNRIKIKIASDKEAEDNRIRIKIAEDKAEADRAARASEATQKVSTECNNKNNCSIRANSLFNTDKACNFNVAYTCGTRAFTNPTPLSGSQTMILNCDDYITTNCTFYLLLEDNGSINIYKGSSPPISGALERPVYNVYTNTSTNPIISNSDWTTNKGKGNFISMNVPLLPGQWLCSTNGSFKLIMQTDGNLVLYTSEIENGCPEINGKKYGIANINAVYKINENIDKSNLGKVAYIDSDANLRDYPETMLQKSNSYTLYDKYDSIGNDISAINNVNNVNDCKTSCNANNLCAGFVYKPSEQKCYLKNVQMYPAGDRQRHENSSFTMGVRIPEIIPNVVKTCDKTIVPIDSVRYNAYKKGNIMNETVNCGITQELTQEQSIFDTVKTSLSNLKDVIIGKSDDAYLSYTKNTKQIIPINTRNATNNKNENAITKAQIGVIKVNEYGIQEGFDINMNDVNSMLSDSDLTILQSNYSYIMWSVLAVGLLSVTVNTVKYS